VKLREVCLVMGRKRFTCRGRGKKKIIRRDAIGHVCRVAGYSDVGCFRPHLMTGDLPIHHPKVALLCVPAYSLIQILHVQCYDGKAELFSSSSKAPYPRFPSSINKFLFFPLYLTILYSNPIKREDKMSLSSSSALRISAQVWPVWLPKAVSTNMPRTVTAGAQTSVKAPIQPSTSNTSILTNQDSLLRNYPAKLVSRSQPNYQETRTFSTSPTSPPLRSSSQNPKST
jgi:hypothetical protein